MKIREELIGDFSFSVQLQVYLIQIMNKYLYKPGLNDFIMLNLNNQLHKADKMKSDQGNDHRVVMWSSA